MFLPIADEVWERIKSVRTAFTKAQNKKMKSGSGGGESNLNERQRRLINRLQFLVPHLRGYKSHSTMEVIEINCVYSSDNKVFLMYLKNY